MTISQARFFRWPRVSTGFWLGGSMPPCRLRRRQFWKFYYEMVHSEVYMNKHVVSIAPFSTTACPDCSLCCMFLLFNISSIFPGGQLTPFAPMCGRPCLWHFPDISWLTSKTAHISRFSRQVVIMLASSTASKRQICISTCRVWMSVSELP